jgi:5-methylcytosine-specific restriction endonuclease McrA
MAQQQRTSKLDGLSSEDRDKLVTRLYEGQNQLCYVCHEILNLQVHKTDVDHIIALARGGPDEESNWALAHSVCNRSKGTRDLRLQRILYQFRMHVQKYTAGAEQGKDRNFTSLFSL